MKPATKLKRHVKSLEDDIEKSHHRIKAFYEGVDIPDGEELDDPPHQFLLEDAADLIAVASTEIPNFTESPDHWTHSRVEYMLYGISAEIILTAVHLKLDPESVIESLDEYGRTSEIGESKSLLIADLSRELTDEQMGIVNLVIQLLRKNRNNLVHLGFHHHFVLNDELAFLSVLGWLISRYSETDIDKLQPIHGRWVQLVVESDMEGVFSKFNFYG